MGQTGVAPARARVRPRSGVSTAVVVLCAIALCAICFGTRERIGDADTVGAGALVFLARLTLILLPIALVISVAAMLLPEGHGKVLPWLVAAVCSVFAAASVIAAIGAAQALRATDACTQLGQDRAGAPGEILRVRWLPPSVECSVFTGPGDDPIIVVSHWAIWLPLLAVPLAVLALLRAARMQRRQQVSPSFRV